ncbi:MAG: sulfatase [Planctomycetes bacterium]|nr:sulfatase [Planctomycetota bacterium]
MLLRAVLWLTVAWNAGPLLGGPPNVVVLLVDDLGVGDVGFSGGTDVPTPCIDRLAREGAVCTDAYVTPSCSPTRAALLTGRYPSRFGIEDNRPLDGPTAALDLREVLLPELLRKHGYHTGLFGKWHLGQGAYGPMARGFEEFCGWIGASGKYLDPPLLSGTTRAVHAGWVDDILAAKAAAFIREHAAEPFFLHVGFMAAHLRQEAEEADLARFAHLDGKRRMAAAIISRLDAAVGRVVDAIRDAGLDGRTLVFFLSDNGGEPPVLGTSNGPYRGQKFDVLEGGIRVPFAVRWPGVVPAGLRFPSPVHCMDVFATTVAAAGIAPAVEIDGVDLLPYLRGETRGVPHERLFWIYNDHADWRRTDQDTNRARRLAAVREGRWKCVMAGDRPVGLYDLQTDPGERHDLSPVQPGRVAAMQRAFEEWYAEMIPQVVADDHPIYGRDGRARP